jgi:hypothetical protein
MKADIDSPRDGASPAPEARGRWPDTGSVSYRPVAIAARLIVPDSPPRSAWDRKAGKAQDAHGGCDLIVGKSWREAKRTCDARADNAKPALKDSLGFSNLGSALLAADEDQASLTEAVQIARGWYSLRGRLFPWVEIPAILIYLICAYFWGLPWPAQVSRLDRIGMSSSR